MQNNQNTEFIDDKQIIERIDEKINLDDRYIDTNSFEQIKKVLFKNNISNIYFYPTIGFTVNVPTYREINHLYAIVLFNLLKELKLQYYVFAGTSVGYVRDKRNIPWVDDFDILLFNDQVDYFIKNVIPILDMYGFKSYKYVFGYKIESKYGQNIFLCDVFYASYKGNDLYYVHQKNPSGIKKSYVIQQKYHTINNNLSIPFVSDVENEVKCYYGDVLNQCVFNILHSPKLSIKKNFNYVYHSFNNIKNDIINNTKNNYINHQYTYNIDMDNILLTNDYITNIDNILKYIYKMNAKTILIYNDIYLFYCSDIKYLFPNIVIEYVFPYVFDIKNAIFLNYVDIIYKDDLNKYSIISDKKKICNDAYFQDILQNKIFNSQVGIHIFTTPKIKDKSMLPKE